MYKFISYLDLIFINMSQINKTCIFIVVLCLTSCHAFDWDTLLNLFKPVGNAETSIIKDFNPLKVIFLFISYKIYLTVLYIQRNF